MEDEEAGGSSRLGSPHTAGATFPCELPLLQAMPAQNRAAGAQLRRRSSPSPGSSLGTVTVSLEQENSQKKKKNWIFLNKNLNSCQPICRQQKAD